MVPLPQPFRPRLHHHWQFRNWTRGSAAAATRPPYRRSGRRRQSHRLLRRVAVTSSAAVERKTLLLTSSLRDLLLPATRTVRPMLANPGQPSCPGSRAAHHGPCRRRLHSLVADRSVPADDGSACKLCADGNGVRPHPHSFKRQDHASSSPFYREKRT